MKKHHKDEIDRLERLVSSRKEKVADAERKLKAAKKRAKEDS